MRRILALMLAAAGSAAPEMRRSLRLALLGALLQAATYAMLVPLLVAVAAPDPAPGLVWTLLAVFALLLTGEKAVRVRELEFGYQQVPTATAALRLRVGEDEPTAALDAASEIALQHALDQLCATRTVVVIAHRLSTVVRADQICVIDGGTVIERGPHPDLLAAGGRYAAMWSAQRSARRWHLPTTTSVIAQDSGCGAGGSQRAQPTADRADC